MKFSSGDIVIVDTYGDFNDWLNVLKIDPYDMNLSAEQFNEKYALIEFPPIKGIFLEEVSIHNQFIRQLLHSSFSYWYMKPSTKINNNKRFNGILVSSPYKKSKSLYVCDIKMQITLDNLRITEWINIEDYNKSEPIKLYNYYKSLQDSPSLGLYGYDKITKTFATFEKWDNARSVKKRIAPISEVNNAKIISFFNDFPESNTKRFPGFIVKNTNKNKYYFVLCSKSLILTSQWNVEKWDSSVI